MTTHKKQVLKCIVFFLTAMLIFTLISNKIDFLLTPEVAVVQPKKGQLFRQITEMGNYRDGKFIFWTNLEKEPYLNLNDQLTVEFVNIPERLPIIIDEKEFDESSQMIGYVCHFLQEPKNTIYDGQRGTARFRYIIGDYDTVIPKECIFYDGAPYVYLIEKSNSMLGDSTIISKSFVNILDTDDYQAAISGSLDYQDQIVQFSNAVLKNEQKVRVIK